jgi:hypothetical protein
MQYYCQYHPMISQCLAGETEANTAALPPPEAQLPSPEHAGPVVQVSRGHRRRPRLQDQFKVLRLDKCAGPKQQVVECRHAHSTCCCAFALLDKGRQHAVPAWVPAEVIEHVITVHSFGTSVPMHYAVPGMSCYMMLFI